MSLCVRGAIAVSLIGLVYGSVFAAPPAENEAAWPAFRGHGNSHAAATDFPLTWSSEENIAWRADITGSGQSSPVIWGQKVFVTAADGSEKERLIVHCFDLRTGATIWTKTFASSKPEAVSGYISQAAPTPVVDADGLYAFFESGDLVALDHAGEVKWSRKLTSDYGPFLGNHGLGCSPAQTTDAVVLLLDHSGPSCLLSIDKQTGKTQWKVDREPRVSWSSPVVVSSRSKSDASEKNSPEIVVSSNGVLEGYAAATGEMLWKLSGIEGNTVPSPTVSDELIVVGSGDAGFNFAVERAGLRRGATPQPLWKNPQVTSSFGSPLLDQGWAYFVNRAGVLFCLDAASGQAAWTQRLPASCWASPIAAGDRVYFFTKEGETVVIQPGNEYRELARNSLPTEDRVYGVAAVANSFVVRTGKQLTCIRSKPQETQTSSAPTTAANPLSSSRSTDSQTSNTSMKYPDLPHGITSFGADRLGNAVYVYGGYFGSAHHYSTEGQSGDLLRLDLNHPTKWETPSTGPKLQGLAMVTYDGKLYRVGGFTAKNTNELEQDLWSQAEFARFDPVHQKWDDLSPMPVPRSSFDAAVVGNVLYVVGGWQMSGSKDAVWHETLCRVDLSKSDVVWESIPQPFQRRALATVGIQNRLFAIGGMNEDGNATTEVQIYDPQKVAWSLGPAIPGKPMDGFGAAACVAQGKLYVSTMEGQLYRLSEDGTAWQKLRTLKTPRFFHRMLPAGDNSLLMLGGVNHDVGRVTAVETISVLPADNGANAAED